MKTPRTAIWLLSIAAASSAFGQPFGLTNRVAATTLRMPSSPPVYAYSTTNALGSMTFTRPVAIVSAPGDTNRLFLVEQPGRIIVITNLASPTRTVFMDISSRVQYGGEEGLLGLAFHPGYLTNRYFFVFYTTVSGVTLQDRLSRFEIAPSNPNQGLPNSELVLISQPDDFNNHNAGDLHFGPDGYLYVSLGDEGDANDTGANSQRIDKDFFSAIMRLDVDKLPGSLAPTPHPASSTNYAVPPDNPFVGATEFNGLPLTGNVRTEFWAVGLRNPWRFSIDSATGLLYCGDVGQGAREEVDVIVKGGNYGWAYREGYIAGPKPSPPPGFNPVQPILDYPRSPAGAANVGYSVIGGVVYRGGRIPQLTGAYIFGDYGSGNIWWLRYDGSITTNVPFSRLLVDPGVAAFGIDPSNGDVLYADVAEGVVRRLVYGPLSTPLPPTLSGTGAFADLRTLTPNVGIISYDVNVPYWSDNAIKSRWFTITNPASRITFRATNNWSFPRSSVWIQNLELELTNGVPESRRRLETRFLMHDEVSGIYGVTYRWDDSQTNGTLVAEAGLDEALLLNDGGILRTQVWHYPSRGECLSCHTLPTVGGFALGFNTPQLNRDFNYGGVTDNQIRALNNAGYFTAAVSNLYILRALAPATNEAASLEWRVRSYISANCAGCHLPVGEGLGTFDVRIFSPLSVTRLINGILANNGGDTNNRVVVPGSLEHSMLLTRISTLGAGRMPPLRSTVTDLDSIRLLSRWITNDLPSYRSFPDWQLSFFGSTNAANALPNADPDNDGANNELEWLAGTNPLLRNEFWAGLGIERTGDAVTISYLRVANRGFELQSTVNSTLASNSWLALNVPENRPFFADTNIPVTVPDLATNAPSKLYRVRVYEP